MVAFGVEKRGRLIENRGLLHKYLIFKEKALPVFYAKLRKAMYGGLQGVCIQRVMNKFSTLFVGIPIRGRFL